MESCSCGASLRHRKKDLIFPCSKLEAKPGFIFLIYENMFGELDEATLFVRVGVKLNWNTRNIKDSCIPWIVG